MFSNFPNNGRNFRRLPKILYGQSWMMIFSNHTLMPLLPFAKKTLFPLYAPSDKFGVIYDPDTKSIKTTPGWREAWAEYAASGWQSVHVPTEYGGQGLPPSLNVAKSLFIGEANWPWAMFPLLSTGAINTVLAAASADIAAKYIPRLASGEWLGTMCLSEPNAGTDLGQVQALATPWHTHPATANTDPPTDNTPTPYALEGTKVWISGGDHDLTDNILHIVLARTPGAQAGTRGLSLFLVPKYLDADMAGPPGGRRPNVHVSRVEDKLGIHGSPTCQLELRGLDGRPAVGWLLGREGEGLRNMFVFMNSARVGVGGQGVAHAELAHQQAAAYALERRSGRCPEGPVDPTAPADPIVSHPDVRRMLLTQRAYAEGGRLLLLECGQALDLEAARRHIGDKGAIHLPDPTGRLAFLTPVAKAFLTDCGVEAASLAVQVHGGMGYVKETGVEQVWRDSRIGPIYEGTNGVQALDLVGRKMAADGLKEFTRWVRDVAEAADAAAQAGAHAPPPDVRGLGGEWLVRGGTRLREAVEGLAQAVRALPQDPVELLANAYEVLTAVGLVDMGRGWARAGAAALAALGPTPPPGDQTDWLLAKAGTAMFYLDRILPRVWGEIRTIEAGAAAVRPSRAPLRDPHALLLR